MDAQLSLRETGLIINQLATDHRLHWRVGAPHWQEVDLLAFQYECSYGLNRGFHSAHRNFSSGRIDSRSLGVGDCQKHG